MSAFVGERKARVTQSLGYFLNVCFSDDKKNIYNLFDCYSVPGGFR